MRRVFALIAIVVALVALAVPSVASSARGLASHAPPLLLLQDGGSYVRAPCLLANGGARTLLCRPDIGVLPVVSFLSPPAAVPFAPNLTDPVLPTHSVEPGLPPPRLA